MWSSILLALVLLLDGGDPIVPVKLETPEGARAPQLAVGQDGRVYVVYGTPKAVYVSISSDAGESFGQPSKVADVGSLSLGLRRGPRIAIAGDGIVVTAIAGEKGDCNDSDVLSWRSADKGKTWTADGAINSVRGSACEGLHAMAAGPEAALFCVWVDFEGKEPSILGSSWNREGSGAWTSPRTVCGDAKRICPCCAPSVAFDATGKIFVMWRGVDGESRDMVVAESSDLGETFSKPAKLGTGTWKINACPMDGGALDFSQLGLEAVWRRDTNVFTSKFTPGQNTLEVEVGPGEQPWLTSGADGPYVAWIERRGGPLLLRRPGMRSAIRLDETASDPVLAAELDTGTRVFATWESGPVGSPKIAVARLLDRPQPKPK